jgi:hypothetical protein
MSWRQRLGDFGTMLSSWQLQQDYLLFDHCPVAGVCSIMSGGNLGHDSSVE